MMTPAERIADRDDLAEMVERKEARIRELEALNAEMLEALKEALPVLEAMQRILAAEAKARGMGGDGPLLDQVRAVISKAEGR